MSDPVGRPDGTAGPGGRPDGTAGPGQRSALARLVVVVGAGVVAAVVLHATDLLIVVLAIVAMIMLHEGGHFVTAKWGRMKVTEYFLGFGPRVWSVRLGETEYGVKAIPAGGYVKVVGMSNLEQVPEADEARTYRQAPFWRRLSVAVAGSVVHFVLAFLLLWSIFALVGVYSATEVSVGSLSHFAHGPTPAQRAGLRPGDVFVSVDGQPVKAEDQLASFIGRHAGRRLTLVVDRQGQRVTLHVTPVRAGSVTYVSTGGASASTEPTGSSGVVGVTLTNPLIRSDPVTAAGQGAQRTWDLTTASVTGLAGLFSPHGISSYVGQVAGRAPATSPSGGGGGGGSNGGGSTGRITSIVGAARLATQAAHAGTADLLLVLADINVFIGLFNMIPLLPLDGGHVAIAIYERVRSRRGERYHADVAKLLPATYAMFLFLVLLGVSAFYLDLVHPIANPFH
ncbi:MAG: M50 family metallopeptidase [Acidimicrobiales bacterium]